jgi:lactoylglutathione lyase
MNLAYVILCVADMGRAVKFYRDTLGLPLKFESPEWSEFVTGQTIFALHPSSAEMPAGTLRLGFNVADLQAVYKGLSAKGVQFTMPPTKQDFGGTLAELVDSEGAHVVLGEG